MPSQIDRLLWTTLHGARLYKRFGPLTLVPRKAYIENLLLVRNSLKDESLADGAIVECGTWKGGMAFGLVEVGGLKRRYHFFDSFAGLPPAKEIDGEAALAYQLNTDDLSYHDNCRADYDTFMSDLARFCPEHERIFVYRGYFEESFPGYPGDPIAVLRLDGDWYDSTLLCLETFFDRVLPGGLIIIDDYLHWDGCSRAVHDFLSRRKAAERIEFTSHKRIPFIRKR